MAGNPNRAIQLNLNPRAGPTDDSEQGFMEIESSFGMNPRHMMAFSSSIRRGEMQDDTSSEEGVPMHDPVPSFSDRGLGNVASEGNLAAGGFTHVQRPRSGTPPRRASGTPQMTKRSPSGQLGPRDSPVMSTSPMGGAINTASFPVNTSRSPSEISRSQSGGSNKTSNYSFSSNQSNPPEEEDDMILFVDPPSKKLYCPLCNTVFTDPVIVSCGHTFCRKCVENKADGQCPVDNVKLTIVVGNIAVGEQIGELYVHCRYGVREDGDSLCVDPVGCPQTVRLNSKREHEMECGYAPNQCPNNPNCPPLLKKDLEEHLRNCQHLKCMHHTHGCEFHGTAEELEAHLPSCHYEALKDYLQATDVRIGKMQHLLDQKDERLGFLANVLGNLSTRVEALEKSVDDRLETVENKQDTVINDIFEMRRSYTQIHDDIAYLQKNQGVQYGAYDPQQIFKCKGTFVGHQGPVWCLTVYQDYLLSGSSDKTIKVWDTLVSMKCSKTLEGHEGIVLALSVSGNKLYSGSQDCKIIVWDLDTFKVEKEVVAHDNPVCTLVCARGQLFSGSLKVIKVWDPQTMELKLEKKDITGLNHWVRALVASDKHLYSGSYQTVKIWDLDTMECVYDLDTSGGSVYSIAITPLYILCGTYENRIHVWEAETYKPVRTLTGHSGTVYALAHLSTPSGTKAFSASYDRSLRVWSLDNMICTQTLQRHTCSVSCLAVSRSNVFSGALDGLIKVWCV